MMQKSALRKTGRALNKMGVYLIPIIMIIVLSIASEFFMTGSNIVNLMMQVAVVGILAIGQTFVIVTGGIDLSVSSLLSFTGCLAIGLYNDMHAGLFIPLLIAVLAGAAIGLLNGIFVARLKIEPFIVTLAMQSIVQALVLFYTKGQPKYINNASELVSDANYGKDFLYIGSGKLFGFLPMPFVIMVVIALILGIFLSKTRPGRYIFAVGGNRETARLSGINVAKYQMIPYILCGITTAFAGIVYAARVGTGLPTMGAGYELNSVAAVVIGGTALSGGKGSIGKTAAGAFIFAILANGLNLLGVSSYYQYLAVGVIILVAVLINNTNSKARVRL
mgnify:CR=1 FL=1